MNSSNGLKSAVYERTIDNVTEYVYATAGTEPKDYRDWKEDFGQLRGKTKQYNESVNIAKLLSNKLSGFELTFVGHSLGGGLAAANALATDKNAITFNPAALSSATKRNLGLYSMNKGNIFNVIIEGEFVDYSQSKLGMSLDGDKIMIHSDYLEATSKLGDLLNMIMRFKNHSIDTVIDKFNGE